MTYPNAAWPGTDRKLPSTLKVRSGSRMTRKFSTEKYPVPYNPDPKKLPGKCTLIRLRTLFFTLTRILYDFSLWCWSGSDLITLMRRIRSGSCSSLKWCESATTGLQTLHFEQLRLHCERPRPSMAPFLSFHRSWMFTLIRIRIWCWIRLFTLISFSKWCSTLLFKSLLPEGSIHIHFCVALAVPGQISNRITYTHHMYSWFNTWHNHCRFSPLIRDLHGRACHHGTRKSAKTGWIRWRFVSVAKSWEGFPSVRPAKKSSQDVSNGFTFSQNRKKTDSFVKNWS